MRNIVLSIGLIFAPLASGLMVVAKANAQTAQVEKPDDATGKPNVRATPFGDPAIKGLKASRGDADQINTKQTPTGSRDVKTFSPNPVAVPNN